MKIINNENQAKKALKDFSETALIPTMGNLHKGHLSLIDKAKKVAQKTIVSIYLNKGWAFSPLTLLVSVKIKSTLKLTSQKFLTSVFVSAS